MTERLSEAARIAGLDPKAVDMALLVGALANLGSSQKTGKIAR